MYQRLNATPSSEKLKPSPAATLHSPMPAAVNPAYGHDFSRIAIARPEEAPRQRRTEEAGNEAAQEAASADLSKTESVTLAPTRAANPASLLPSPLPVQRHLGHSLNTFSLYPPLNAQAAKQAPVAAQNADSGETLSAAMQGEPQDYDPSAGVIQGKWKELLGLGGLAVGVGLAAAAAPVAMGGLVATGLGALVGGAVGYFTGQQLDTASEETQNNASQSESVPNASTPPPLTTTPSLTTPSTSTTPTPSSLISSPSTTSSATPLNSINNNSLETGSTNSVKAKPPLILSGQQVAEFVALVNPKGFRSLGKFMQAAEKVFRAEGTSEEWKLNRANIQGRAGRHFDDERSEGKKEKNEDKEEAPEARPYAFDDSTTWNMQAIVSAPGMSRDDVVLDAHDEQYMAALGRGDLTNNRVGGGAVVGVHYHAHMRGNGGGGIAFYYEHTGDGNVRPVIYDWALNRTGNDYNWRSGVRSNAAP